MILRLIMALGFMLAISSASAAVDRTAFLAAVAARESGSNPARIGPIGERSAYQFTAATWRFYTAEPFEMATSNPVLADQIAIRHFDQLCRELTILDVPREPAFLAAEWRQGSARAKLFAGGSYAREVCNLYAEIVARKEHR